MTLSRALVALTLLALVFAPAPPQARAESIPSKISPALLARMQADPLKLLPVIVEMQAPAFPFTTAPNVARANEALDLLRVNGRPVGALSIVESAAGFADALDYYRKAGALPLQVRFGTPFAQRVEGTGT